MAQAWEDLELSLVKQTNGHSPSLPSDWARDGNGLSSSVRSPLVGQPEMEVIDLSHTCYNLIFVSGKTSVLAPMLAVAVGQFGMLWIVGWSSPEYFFESGQWVVPISDYWTVNAMKCLSMLLTFFRVSGEFKDAAKLYRVLAHRPAVHMTLQQRILGTGAFLLQYIVAVVVVLMAIQLILTSTTPIATIGKLWVVFTTLDFDNYLCSFILFIFDCEHAFDWEVKLQCQSRRLSPEMRSRTWLLIYWAPVTVAVLCVALSLCFNICPLTVLHYGAVSNADPVLMLSSTFGLPEGCCSPQVTDQAENGVAVSVPCVSSSQAGRALVYYVVVPDGRPSPSSLQVMEGRGGDGNRGLRYGQVTATPLQMRWWLTRHGFDVSVYLAMRKSTAGGLALYQSSFPHLAEWTIPDFPWTHRARIFVAAVNPSTGALSPAVVQSPVILRKVCSPHCLRCDSHGSCLDCEPGFVAEEPPHPNSVGDVAPNRVCLPCSDGCAHCSHAGAGRCDAAGCLPGFGISAGRCLPCVSPLCLCDEDPRQSAAETTTGSAPLPCRSCPATFGLSKGNCLPCQVVGCNDCPGQACQECMEGATLKTSAIHNESVQECLPCADHCSRCEALGEGRCDPEMCHQGFSLTATGSCAPCSMHCQNCTRAGPGRCDLGSCRSGYGLQGGAECSKCKVEGCLVCDSPYGCDVCREGFGLTSDKSCEACAANCRRCGASGDREGAGCAECHQGFGLQGGRCFSCADQCEICVKTGPGQCDPDACAAGWTVQNQSGSAVCVRDVRFTHV
ncbi:unnamed protein product [Durusdinium trenchii]|uniref:Uncharacterized protein n=2 Tax=Durusdinium trenchii TaxID=1381693 RepID=A0ABP0QRD8_9DINO